MNAANPLIIVGTGRCGSSGLHEIMSRHGDLAWLCTLSARFPTRPAVSRGAMRAIDLPLVGSAARRLVRPSEAYAFWDHRYRGFGSPFRDLTEADITVTAMKALRQDFDEILTKRRRRLLIKITGWPRVGFLKRVFPTARFVHIYRDGRAVANSLMERPWWDGWRGPHSWKWGPLGADRQKLWEASGHSFVVLAGLEWDLLMQAFQAVKTEISSDRFLEVRYEDLCQQKEAVLKRIVEFAHLDWTPSFGEAVARFPFVDANRKWRERLTGEQQNELTRALHNTLVRYGYLGPEEERSVVDVHPSTVKMHAKG